MITYQMVLIHGASTLRRVKTRKPYLKTTKSLLLLLLALQRSELF